MCQLITSIFDNHIIFILLRRGIPVICVLLFMGLSILNPTGQIWYLLGAMIFLIEVIPTFKRGKSYVNSRIRILRHDLIWVKALRPITRWLNVENAWIMSFCYWNNHRIMQVFQKRKATRAILLLPHCIQATHCNADILKGLNHCYRCNLCIMSELLSMQSKYGCEIRIANRSNKAYEEAQAYNPELIIAISCPDRLLKGITKLLWAPSYVIPLRLDHGMCVNTTFNISELIVAIETLLESKVP